MPVLTEAQIKEGYFDIIGGFPPRKSITEVKEYRGEDRLCIFCTQLDSLGYSAHEQRRILTEWIDFLGNNTAAFTALHFNSRVPQALFNAACCQKNLEELRLKWGAYADLSALKTLKSLTIYISDPAQAFKT